MLLLILGLMLGSRVLRADLPSSGPVRQAEALVRANILPDEARSSTEQASGYVSVTSKTVDGYTLQRGPSYVMRHTQCLGYLPPSYLCGSSEPLGVEVSVTDGVGYPQVMVAGTLLNASVARRPDVYGVCRGVADVRTRLLCRGSRPAHDHHVLALLP